MSDETFTPRDIVYTGKRLTDSKAPGISFIVLNDDGTLGKSMTITMKRGRDKVVGYTYTGAEFNDDFTVVKGFDGIRLLRQWPNQGDRMTWVARDEEVEARAKAKTLEQNAAKVTDIERIMLPLRKLYEGHRKAGRWSDKEALEAAVLRALRAAPRAGEA